MTTTEKPIWDRSCDPAVLKYAGGAGHEYASVGGGIDVPARVTGEYTSLDSARRLASIGDRIYRRTVKTWRYVETRYTP